MTSRYSYRHEHRKKKLEIPMLRIKAVGNKLIGTADNFRAFAYLGKNNDAESARRAIYQEFEEHRRRIAKNEIL